MFAIYHNGVQLGTISLSEKTLALLDEGENVTVLYHTPQLLRDQLGQRNGAFALYKEGDHIMTDSPERLSEYLQLQSAIAAAQGG